VRYPVFALGCATHAKDPPMHNTVALASALNQAHIFAAAP